MKLKEMEAVFNYICTDLQPENIDEWVAYKNNMEKLFTELKPYYEPDENNNYKSITEAEYENISKIFDTVAKKSNTLIKAYSKVNEKGVDKYGRPAPGVVELVKNLNDEFFSKGYVEFKNIKPNPNIPLKDQLDNFRDLFVSISNQDIKKLGGYQSSRLQMSVNLDGEEIKGVFTNKTFYNAKEDFASLFSGFAEKYPKYKDFYEAIDPKKFFEDEVFRNSDIENLLQGDGAIDDEDLREEAIKSYLSKAGFPQVVRDKGAAYAKDDDFYKSLLDFSAQLPMVSTNILYNKVGLDLNNLERIDVRNSAMSAVANLIKVPNLVAKARNLAVYDEAGKKITDGTFMEFAKGKDLINLAPVDEMRLMTAENFENYQIKKQLADLQILDYICGNIDRHAGNMLYDIDPATKNLKGIVGIDNDSSFGKNVPNPNKSTVRLPSINGMRVISEDMANRIQNLTEGELRSTLHGYGLSEKSIDAAWERTKQLQMAIENGEPYKKHNAIVGVVSSYNPFITVMSDEDFKSVNLAYCAGNSENYFAQLIRVKDSFKTPDELDDRLHQRAFALNSGFVSAIGKGQTQVFVNKAKQAAPKWFASNRYKNFMAKLNDFHNTEIKGTNPFTEENKVKFDKLDELKKAIEVYKSEKIRDGYIDDKWNLKKKVTGKDLDRILLVKDTEKYVNRIEKEKILAQDAKTKYEDTLNNVNEANKFFNMSKNEKIKLVEDKLKALGVDLKKKDETVIKANAIEDEINKKLVLKKDGNKIIIDEPDDEESFFSDEEDLNNDNINDKDLEKEI